MSIGDELRKLQEAAVGGVLFPSAVVEWAREHPGSALHRSIEWDDEKAADEYRLVQVRRLIRLHVVSVDGMPETVSLSIDRKADGGYRRMSDVLANRSLREIMLADALQDLERVQSRYQQVEELAEVWAARDRIAERKGGRRIRRKPTEDRPTA